MLITLTWAELSIASQVGIRRNLEAMRDGRRPKHGFAGSTRDIHIEGACGEMAFAKSMGLYWNGSVNTFKQGGDVGRHQVRTRSKDTYDLIVRYDDRDEDIFWLVTGTAPTYNVVGHIKGIDAKQDRFRQSYGGRPEAWFVPSSFLKLYEGEQDGET
jgi:hypothetical protein